MNQSDDYRFITVLVFLFGLICFICSILPSKDPSSSADIEGKSIHRVSYYALLGSKNIIKKEEIGGWMESYLKATKDL